VARKLKPRIKKSEKEKENDNDVFYYSQSNTCGFTFGPSGKQLN